MKITKEGLKPDDREHSWHCLRCGCAWTAFRKEARYISDQRDGDALVMKCPYCKKETWTNAKWNPPTPGDAEAR